MGWGDTGYGLGGRGRQAQSARRISQRSNWNPTPAQSEYLRSAGQYARQNNLPLGGTGGVLSPGAYSGFMSTYQAGGGAAPGAPSLGGGGGGRGGGGGGGGGGGMTQSMFDAMVRALGTTGPRLDYPAFQGRPMGAFNARPYTQALGQVGEAVTADRAASAAAGQEATRALQGNYTNAYANTQVQGAPAAQPVGAALQATTGGGGNQTAVAAETNQAAGQDQAAFANLLNVLAANDQTNQASRLNQVALDQATAGRGINAQALGLRGGINTARAGAENQWRTASNERDYQNSLMRQQWEREEQQANWQQRNEMISGRLTPLLELLGSSRGVNTNALQQLLASWGRR